MITLLLNILLTWSSVDAVEGYRVFVGNSSGKYEKVYKVKESRIRIAVKKNKPLYIAIKSFNKYGESDYSEEVTISRGKTIQISAKK